MAPTSGAPASSAHVIRALHIVGEYQKRPLEPVERFSEAIFGLVMVLAFTCSLSVATSGQQEVRQMLAAALACNVAWGVVDGVMYVLTAVVERARRRVVFQGIRVADPATARAIVLGALPEGVAAITEEAEADRMVARVRALPEPARPSSITVAELRGAVGSCLLVVLATFPPTIPFLLVEDAVRALRISNGVALVSLFLAGYWLGKETGVRAWRLGLAMTVVGSALVGLTIALGG
jgi:VIT1/CCC1 family predicted Fe2+/Mn2+ transporter